MALSDDIHDAIAQAYGSSPQPVDPISDAIADAYKPIQAPASQPTMPAAPLAKGERFMQGLTDLPTGLGQIAEHVAETPLNALRWTIRKGLESAGASDVAQLFNPVSANDFDQIVQQREQNYQQARQAAGQTGIDWWRLGGQVADPINYLGAGSGAAATAWGRIGQAAAQGAAVTAAQPSLTPGSFWWDKAKGVALGGITGAATAGIIETALPAIRMGINAVRNALGSEAAQSSPAAETVVNDALRAKGVDPNSIDLNVLGALKQEAQSALDHDAEPSAEAIANRARAESLPIPVRLMRGQATGDPAAFSAEQNLRGIAGVGEPLTQRLQEQNQAFIQNLDELGAKNAPDTVSTGQKMAAQIQMAWDTLQSRKEQLYAAVRNSDGQPAAMDQFKAVQDIKAALDTPEASHAYDLLPTHIQRTLDDLDDGKLPLTVGQFQSLDKMWGADARAADGSTAHAINTVRQILGNSDIRDDVGQQALQAWNEAKAAHAQQMSLIDPKLLNGTPNPSFQPLFKAVVVDGKPPESLFNTHFMNAAPSVAQKNLQLMNSIDPDSMETIGRTMMGEIKRQALSSASDERGTISQSVLNGWARDPVKAARMDALLPSPQVSTFRNLAATVEAAKRFPVASTVNTSNTGSALVNAATAALKSSVAGQIAKRLPIAKTVAEGMEAAQTQTAVQNALNPGVTLNSLLSSTPSQAATRRLISQAAVPALIAAQQNKEASQ